MALDVEIPINEIETDAVAPSKTYFLDLDNGRIIGKIDGLEAVKQAVRKAVITSRYKNLIYDGDYGSQVKDMIYDEKSTPELIETALPELIKDALSQDTRILNVYDFNFSFEKDKAFISFSVDTIYGGFNIDEVII